MNAFFSDRLDWQTLGYTAPPILPTDPRLRENPDRSLWLRLEEILGAAKRARFAGIPGLLDLYDSAQTAVFQYACSRVVGDAGTTDCFVQILKRLDRDAPQDINRVIHYCSALRCWGSLSCVPIIVEQYRRFRSSRSAAILPVYLSSLLEGEWGPVASELPKEEVSEYCNVVISRYLELKDRLKTDRIIVFGGEAASVPRFGRFLLRHLSNSDFDRVMQPFLRRRFEASTGIDCSVFYKDRRFQPLSAAAVVEEFFERGEADEYEEGVRYFFGHRIQE